MSIAIQSSLESLNKMLAAYVAVSHKLPADVLLKKGASLGFELEARMRRVMPAKGSITADILAKLKSGIGVFVRPGLRRKLQEKMGFANAVSKTRSGKVVTGYGPRLLNSFKRKGVRMNFQALAVKAEISARERGRGYSGFASRIRSFSQLSAAIDNKKSVYHRGRYNQLLASASIEMKFDGGEILFLYGNQGTDAFEAMSTPYAQTAIAESADAVRDDMIPYIQDKLRKAGSL